MRGAVIYAPGDVRFEDRPDPTILKPTDAVIRTVAACVCGSDLWRYRGIADAPKPTPIGHEYVGVVDPGRVFDLTLPLDQVAEGYAAMDQRRAIKALLRT